ncbi:uncharacterized protein LOC128249940 isoform X2 [Octopus bimaculoides]|uniref:uncharacterized protein LOC128249940 isoform X2 n=1 Tax=Octopus bimaculoides TaxID=37653 RepID=UPI0022E5F2EC|nr:uncharacterized protein LOC128249940 isoform X2 [Octopus bimaculoides]
MRILILLSFVLLFAEAAMKNKCFKLETPRCNALYQHYLSNEDTCKDYVEFLRCIDLDDKTCKEKYKVMHACIKQALKGSSCKHKITFRASILTAVVGTLLMHT